MGEYDDVYNDVYGDDAVDDDSLVCKVYDKNDFFTTAVQLALAFLALASLYLKRLREVPRRKFRTWSLDISKQAFGACYAHVLNMIVAAVIADNVRGDSYLSDQCAWYAINYLIDTTFGLVLAIIFIRLLDTCANKHGWSALKDSGVYHGKSGMLHWLVQVFAWIFILTLVKGILCVFMWIGSEPLAYIGMLLFKPLQSNIRFELVFVMIFFPGVLNVIYFWITDGFLKAKDGQKHAHEPETMMEGIGEDSNNDRTEGLLNQDEPVTESTGEQQETTSTWGTFSLPPWVSSGTVGAITAFGLPNPETELVSKTSKSDVV